MPLQYIYVPLEEKREWILIKSHPLTPQFSAHLFAQKGSGALQFTAARIKWSQNELEGLQKI